MAVLPVNEVRPDPLSHKRDKRGEAQRRAQKGGSPQATVGKVRETPRWPGCYLESTGNRQYGGAEAGGHQARSGVERKCVHVEAGSEQPGGARMWRGAQRRV